jgi:hypothetical protein
MYKNLDLTFISTIYVKKLINFSGRMYVVSI